MKLKKLPTIYMTLYTLYTFEKSLLYRLVTILKEVIRVIHTPNSNKYLYKNI